MSADENDEILAALRAMKPFLSDAEVARIEAVSDVPNDIALSRILHWAEDARITAGLLENVLEGSIRCEWDFDADDIKFRMSNVGMERAEALIAGRLRRDQ